MLQISTVVEDDNVVLTWAETGGPPLETVPSLTGFGSKMIERSLTKGLAGSITYDWQPTGLVARLTMGKDRLAL